MFDLAWYQVVIAAGAGLLIGATTRLGGLGGPRAFPLRAYAYAILLSFLLAYSSATELGERVVSQDPEVGERVTEVAYVASGSERWDKFKTQLELVWSMLAGVGVMHFVRMRALARGIDMSIGFVEDDR